MFSSIVASPRSTLSPQQALELAKVYLENARNARDIKISLVLCHDTEVSLYQAKKAVKGTKDNAVQDGIATTYTDLGVLLHGLDCQREAKASFEKAQKLGLSVPASDVFAAASLSAPHSRPYPDAFKSNRDILPSGSSAPQTDNIAILQGDTTTAPPAKFSSAPVNDILEGPLEDKRTTSDGDTVTIPLNIFVGNVRPPAIMFKPPETDERLSDTLQLAYCLGLLQVATLVEHITDPVVHNWLQATTANQDEQERLKAMARNVVRAFKRDELKDSKAVTEVVYLAPVLEKEDFQYLLREFYSGIGNSELLDVHQLEGLAQLIQGADRNFVEANDLVKILELLGLRLKSTHSQSPTQLYKLALTVSHVLDAMADAGVKDLDRVNLHEPLSSYLDALKKSPDSYLVYQAAYASQALLYVPDDESLGKAALRRTGKVIQGISGLVSAVKGLDFNGLIEGLQNIQSGFSGAGKVVGTIKTAYDKAMSLTEGGEGFMKGLKEGFSFDRKCAWYPALRGADALIRNGQFAKFKRLVCESPCRHGQAFQWGVCQRLRDIASNPMWDINNRRSAVSFLGEIYQKDAEWGHHPTIKQWILNILMQLSALSSDDMQCKYGQQHTILMISTLIVSKN
ncbi:hypothetical protein BGX31_011570 [Mortierella sp. GBA43]|nr:hypothetical protein BGX31_011570 [Mortierella sp. GBA43]